MSHSTEHPEPTTRRAGIIRSPRPRTDRERRPRFFPGDPRAVGSDPDYRFTLANERTFLAWIRTALALAAGGLAALTVLEDVPGEEVLAIGLLALSFLTSATSYRRWALNERAIRLGEPLPASRLPLVMSVAVAIVAVGSALLFAFGL